MDTISAIFMIVLFITLLVLLVRAFYGDGYKAGQVDAINGEIKYTLCESEDGIRKYYKKSEIKDFKNLKIIEK